MVHPSTVSSACTFSMARYGSHGPQSKWFTFTYIYIDLPWEELNVLPPSAVAGEPIVLLPPHVVAHIKSSQLPPRPESKKCSWKNPIYLMKMKQLIYTMSTCNSVVFCHLLSPSVIPTGPVGPALMSTCDHTSDFSWPSMQSCSICT